MGFHVISYDFFLFFEYFCFFDILFFSFMGFPAHILKQPRAIQPNHFTYSMGCPAHNSMGFSAQLLHFLGSFLKL